MAVLLGIVILAVVIIWSRRGGALNRMGRVGVERKTQRCDWQRVDPTTTRMLKEYRCARCNNVAYGRGEAPPNDRPCRAG